MKLKEGYYEYFLLQTAKVAYVANHGNNFDTSRYYLVTFHYNIAGFNDFPVRWTFINIAGLINIGANYYCFCVSWQGDACAMGPA